MSDQLAAIHAGRVCVAVLFEPRDLLIGAYWNVSETIEDYRHTRRLDVYVCLLPLLPLRVSVYYRRIRG